MSSPDEFDEVGIENNISDFLSFEQQVSVEVAEAARLKPQDYTNAVSSEFPKIAPNNSSNHNANEVMDLYDELRMGERKPIVLEVEPED